MCSHSAHVPYVGEPTVECAVDQLTPHGSAQALKNKMAIIVS